MLPKVKLIRVRKEGETFDNPDWVYEIKHDGYRALAYVEKGQCRLVSRNGNVFQQFGPLAEWLSENLSVEDAILDGEVVCLDDRGRSQFYDLLFRRGTPRFYAFDLIWLNGEDLREQPLLERKARLRELIPEPASFMLYVDHLEDQGVEFFKRVCEIDLEGIVAKRKNGFYLPSTRWLKIKNPNYSQAEGRQKLFDSMRR